MRLFVRSDGLFEPSQPLQRFRTQMQRLDVVGFKLMTQIEVDKSFLEALRLIEEQRDAFRRLPMTRRALERVLKAQDRLGRTLKLVERPRKIAPELCIIGLELHRLIERLESLFAAPLLQQRGAKCRQIKRFRPLP